MRCGCATRCASTALSLAMAAADPLNWGVPWHKTTQRNQSKRLLTHKGKASALCNSRGFLSISLRGSTQPLSPTHCFGSLQPTLLISAIARTGTTSLELQLVTRPLVLQSDTRHHHALRHSPHASPSPSMPPAMLTTSTSARTSSTTRHQHPQLCARAPPTSTPQPMLRKQCCSCRRWSRGRWRTHMGAWSAPRT